MDTVLIVAPHPDDETLGCGGTILKHKKNGDMPYWLIITEISQILGYSDEAIRTRHDEIIKITSFYGFHEVYQCGYPTTKLDTLPIKDLVEKLSDIFDAIKPSIVYLPFKDDVHTDHQVVFKAVASCTKWFRHPSIKRILAYETLSETDFNLGMNGAFRPNYYVNIDEFIDKKLEALAIYRTEVAEFPFPRSLKALRSLAYLRGAASGYEAAEAFELLRERQ